MCFFFCSPCASVSIYFSFWFFVNFFLELSGRKPRKPSEKIAILRHTDISISHIGKTRKHFEFETDIRFHQTIWLSHFFLSLSLTLSHTLDRRLMNDTDGSGSRVQGMRKKNSYTSKKYWIHLFGLVHTHTHIIKRYLCTKHISNNNV